MKVNQRELVLISYPFSNLELRKVRPALVISNDLFNTKSDDCIMVPLTTIIKNELYSIVINQEDLEEGKLLKKSRIRIDKIFSAEKSLVIIKIGKLNENVFERVIGEISSIF
ncbi:MAG: type II toxin-antitoxin system PemK/MazF family toxin [archaeon]